MRIPLPSAKYIFLIVLLLSAEVVAAQQYVRQRFEADPPESGNSRIENILYLAAGIALQEYGFSSSRRDAGAKYELLTRYRIEGSRISLSYYWAMASDDEETTTVGTLLQVDSVLDDSLERDISDALMELLAEAEVEPVEEASGFGSSIELLDDSRPGPSITEEPTDDVIATPEPEEPVDLEEHEKERFEESEQPIPKYIYAGTSISGGFFMLESADFFRLQPAVDLSLGRFWLYGNAELGAGLQLTSGPVLNKEGIQGGPLIVSTFGPELFSSRKAWNNGSWFFRFSAGAAVLSLSTAENFLHKSVAYTGAALGYTINLFGKTETGILLRVRSVFDQDFPLVTFGPALYMRMNWSYEKD
ncbi:hypothetical protein [Spirochaeta dissipatitropha]